ncbi:hypothetical protein KC921_05010 [Candidatus Woesebacteria bacterium]|nr:hypothetical protein [Candidatus Woesebacteria bacterium]
MKKRTLVPTAVLFGLAIAVLAPRAFAEIPERMETRTELRQEAVDTRQEAVDAREEARVTQAEERQQERNDTLRQVQINAQERRSEFAQQHAERIERRYALYAERLLNLADRIEARAQILSADGTDVSAALAKVTEARTLIESAQSSGDEAVTEFRSIDPATYEEQRDVALAARDLAETSIADFKAARDLLQEAVRLLLATTK